MASSCLATFSGPAGPGGARRTLATAVALLALPALPLITACVFADEILFARRYGMAFAKGRARHEVGAMSTAAAAGHAA